MARAIERRRGGTHAELQSWYVDSLLPRLAQAVEAGKAEPAAVAALDRDLRDLLGLGYRRATTKAA